MLSIILYHDEGFYTWYTLALNVFLEFSNIDKCFHKIKVPFKKVVHNNYIQKTKDKLSKLTVNSKLYLYNKIKHQEGGGIFHMKYPKNFHSAQFF
jgi:hypothetical protein